ncbi:MAG: hypothetical protein R3F11_13490 [Verrucomicrobiales bacterium]
MTLEEIHREASLLSPRERGDLAFRLIDSLGSPKLAGGDEEVARRIMEIESGEVEDISHAELIARLKIRPRP